MDMITGAGGRLCSSVEAADLIITKIVAATRLRNSLTPEQVAGKRVLHVRWLEESVTLGVAQPMGGKYELVMSPGSSSQPQASSSSAMPPAVAMTSRQTGSMENPVVTLDRAVSVRPPRWHNTALSCERWSPLVSPNDDLVRELGWIHRDRWLGRGDSPGSFDSNALAYARAIAQIKAAPVRLELKHVARMKKKTLVLDHLGGKMLSLIEEFIKTGRIEDAGAPVAHQLSR